MYRAERITIAAIVVFICGLTLIGWLSGYPRQAILFPTIAAVLVVVFAAMRLLEIVRKTEAAGPDPDYETKQELVSDAGELEILSAVIPFLWVFSALLFLWLFGFLVGLALYVAVFLLAHGMGWIRSILISAATGVFVYVVFQIILSVLLPAGLIAGLLGY